MKPPKKSTSRSRAGRKRLLSRELLSLLVAIGVALHCLLQYLEPFKQVSPSYPLEQASVKVGFSPEGTAQLLVLEAIRAAKETLHIAAYALTAIDISRALLDAQQRGVRIFITIDGNLATSQLLQNKARGEPSAIALLAAAPVSLRFNYRYGAHHDKYMIIDQQHIQTGSFNYSRAAEKRNSENVILLYHVPELAAAYLGHWRARWEEAEVYNEERAKTTH